jgi:hypothetical protein
MSITQYIEDTKYMQWEDGMYVMLDDLLCDYEKALIEDSLRGSVYFEGGVDFKSIDNENCLGVCFFCAGLWFSVGTNKLTRAQALYIATKKTET